MPMPSIRLSVTRDMLAKLQQLARGNGRSLDHEVRLRIAETMSAQARARKAKIAIVAGTLVEAKAHALSSELRRDEWFYAYSVDSAVGRYVRRIETVGTYRRHKQLGAILRELRGGELTAKAHAA